MVVSYLHVDTYILATKCLTYLPTSIVTTYIIYLLNMIFTHLHKQLPMYCEVKVGWSM